MDSTNKKQYLETILEFIYSLDTHNQELAFTITQNIIKDTILVSTKINRELLSNLKKIKEKKDFLKQDHGIRKKGDAKSNFEKMRKLNLVNTEINTLKEKNEALVIFLDRLLK